MLLLLSLRSEVNSQCEGGTTPIWLAANNGKPTTVRLLVSHRASIDLASHQQQMTPLFIAAHQNKPECIAVLAAAKASLEGAMALSPIGTAAYHGSDDSVHLLAHLGARFIEPTAPGWPGGPFWRRFQDNIGRVRDPKVWEWIVSKGGDEGTPSSLRKRIRMLKKAEIPDPRDLWS